MHLQDGVHTQATGDTPKGTIHTSTYPPSHTPQALFALLSPLLSQAFASVFLDVLPDSPVDLVAWHTVGKQASRRAWPPPDPHPRDIAPRRPAYTGAGACPCRRRTSPSPLSVARR